MGNGAWAPECTQAGGPLSQRLSVTCTNIATPPPAPLRVGNGQPLPEDGRLLSHIP